MGLQPSKHGARAPTQATGSDDVSVPMCDPRMQMDGFAGASAEGGITRETAGPDTLQEWSVRVPEEPGAGTELGEVVGASAVEVQRGWDAGRRSATSIGDLDLRPGRTWSAPDGYR